MIVFAVLALVGALATVSSLAVLHGLPTGLSPLRDPVSAYGISRFAVLYRAQTLGTALAAASLAVAFVVAIGAAATPAVVSLTALAVARGIIGWFPMDAPGRARSGTGRFHDLLAYAAFAAAAVSGFMIAIAFSSEPRLAPFSGVASTLGWITTVAGALTVVSSMARPLRRVFGLAERLIYVGMLALIVFAAIVLVLAG